MDIRELQQQCWQTAEDKGFHEDRPKRSQYDTSDAFKKALTNWQGNKLLLMVSEITEGHDELRKGFAADGMYYSGDPVGDIPGKPEGLPSELADTVIRILDFCGTEGIDLQAVIEEKLAFNATRERLHGRKF